MRIQTGPKVCIILIELLGFPSLRIDDDENVSMRFDTYCARN